MSRAAFLSAGGDVFIASMVLELWKKYWYDEIDHMWICLNNHAGTPKEAISEFLAKWSQEPKVRIIFSPQGWGNGKPISLMTKCSDDDLVMLLEDDGFIFTPGKVNHCFQQIESDLTDALGSPRFSCGQEIAEALKQRYSLDYSGYGDVGPNFWPNFFFCKREDLLKTDLNFGSKTFLEGQYYPELNHQMEKTEHGDTFVWGCIQLRALGLRSQNIPQFHCSPTEVQDKDQKTMNWIGETPYWLHGGSLSTSWNGYLTGNPPDLSNDNAIKELETRIAWWTICSDVVDGFDDFKVQYKQGIENILNNHSAFDRKRVDQKISLYRGLLKV